MTDLQAYELLSLLHEYVSECTPDIPQTIGALADDLATSLQEGFAPAEKPRRLADEIIATAGVS